MRVLIADDQPRVRFAVRALLETEPGMQVVNEAVDAEELMARTAVCTPDLVLLDWELPGLMADDSLSTLRRVCPSVAVIALSARLEAHQAALAAGADAFVSKTEPPDRLLTAIPRNGGA
jgi:DNA-binding NarL/FixJ family response regulator